MNMFKRKQYSSLEKFEPFLPLDIEKKHVRWHLSTFKLHRTWRKKSKKPKL